jgi:hypothetical protein
MAGRGPQTFKKRQKEQQRKEKQAEKAEKRLLRKQNKDAGIAPPEDEEPLLGPPPVDAQLLP